MGLAYHGKAEIQAMLTRRLETAFKSGRLKPGTFSYTDERASLAGSLLDNADISTWEEMLGLPQWLALVIDRLTSFDSAEGAAAFGHKLTVAISPGDALSAVASRYIVFMLEDISAQISTTSSQINDAMTAVLNLHRAIVQGVTTEAPQWRSARRAATAATDSTKGEVERLLAACVETAAWNPATSPTVVFDTLRMWGNAHRELVAYREGWRVDYEPVLREHMRILFEKYIKDQPTDVAKPLTVFDLLPEHYPESHRLIQLRKRIDTEADRTFFPIAAQKLLDLLQAS